MMHLLIFAFFYNVSAEASNSWLEKSSFKLCLTRVFQVDEERLKFNTWPEDLTLSCNRVLTYFQCKLTDKTGKPSALSGKFTIGSGYVDLKRKTNEGDTIQLRKCEMPDRDGDALDSPVSCDVKVEYFLHSWNGSNWKSYYNGKFCK